MATVETGVAGGVSFALTDEQKRAARARARRSPRRRSGRGRPSVTSIRPMPTDIIAKAHEVGLMNVHLPECARRARAPLLRRDARRRGAQLGLLGHRHLDRRQRPRRRPDPDRGQRRAEEAVARAARRGARSSAASALTEPGAGSDVSGIQTTAVRRGDEYVINGSKMFITNAGPRVVDGRASPRPTRRRGTRGSRRSWSRWTRAGVTIEKHLDKMGQRATDTSAVAFQDVVVPAANRLGEEGDGFKIAMQTLDFTRPGTAIGAVGVAQAAFELSVEYTKERVQFGHADRDEPGRQLPGRRHGDRDRGGAAAHAGRRPG